MSISVPPDVAEILAEQPNASAYVAEAVRDRKRLEDLETELARAGIAVTEQGVAAAKARRAAVDAAWPAERYAAVRDRVRQHLSDEAVGTTETPAA